MVSVCLSRSKTTIQSYMYYTVVHCTCVHGTKQHLSSNCSSVQCTCIMYSAVVLCSKSFVPKHVRSVGFRILNLQTTPTNSWSTQVIVFVCLLSTTKSDQCDMLLDKLLSYSYMSTCTIMNTYKILQTNFFLMELQCRHPYFVQL